MLAKDLQTEQELSFCDKILHVHWEKVCFKSGTWAHNYEYWPTKNASTNKI